MSNEEKIIEMLGQVVERLDGIENRLDNVEKDVKDVKRQLNRVESIQHTHSEYLFSMFNAINSLNDRFIKRTASIQNLNLENADDLIVLKEKFEDLDYRVRKLEKAQ